MSGVDVAWFSQFTSEDGELRISGMNRMLDAINAKLAEALRTIDTGLDDAGQDPYCRGDDTARDIARDALAKVGEK